MALFKLKPVEAVDFSTLVRPSSPNTYLVCPDGFSAVAADQEAPIYRVPVSSLQTAWDAMMSQQPRTEVLDRTEDGHKRTYVQRTALMGYPDVVSVQFIPDGETKSTLAVYSRSQYGYSDMGTNRKRVIAWLQALAETLN